MITDGVKKSLHRVERGYGTRSRAERRKQTKPPRPTHVSKMTPEERLDRWRKGIAVASLEIQILSIGHDIFGEVGRIVMANPKLREINPFVWYLETAYLDWSVMCARRLVDDRPEAHSFLRLLDEVARHPASLSREAYLAGFRHALPQSLFSLIVRPRAALADQDIEAVANARFDELVGRGSVQITSEQVRDDRQQLKAAADVLEQYADNFVAHRSREARLVPGLVPVAKRPLGAGELKNVAFPSEGDLKNLVKVSKSLLEKYYALLNGVPPLLGAPPPNWKEIFCFPWIQ